jgi:hypothetical protein
MPWHAKLQAQPVISKGSIHQLESFQHICRSGSLHWLMLLLFEQRIVAETLDSVPHLRCTVLWLQVELRSTWNLETSALFQSNAHVAAAQALSMVLCNPKA